MGIVISRGATAMADSLRDFLLFPFPLVCIRGTGVADNRPFLFGSRQEAMCPAQTRTSLP